MFVKELLVVLLFTVLPTKLWITIFYVVVRLLLVTVSINRLKHFQLLGSVFHHSLGVYLERHMIDKVSQACENVTNDFG